MQTFQLPSQWIVRFITLVITTFSVSAWSQQENEVPQSVYERIWDAAYLYGNEDNPTIQSFSLIGRYHGQFWSVNADQGNAQDWENRRMIVGFSSKWFSNITVQAQMFLKSGSGTHYNGLYEAFLKWSLSGSVKSVSIGRLDYLFTGYERSSSSKKINAIERGLLVNQVMPAEIVGMHLKGDKGPVSYHAGLFRRQH